MNERYLTKDGLLLTEEISRDLEKNYIHSMDIKDYVRLHEVTSEEREFWGNWIDGNSRTIYIERRFYIGSYEIKVSENGIIGTRKSMTT